MAALLVACGDTPSSAAATADSPPARNSPSAQPTQDYSNDPASLLAQRDGASDVAPYAAALDHLQPKCTQDRVGIAGLGDAGFTDLTKNGITDETRLTVLQHLNESIPDGSKVDCQSSLAAYLVLREGQ